ncbi:DEAD/DEAH box helicase [Gleimia sp. 6138-11-ORH1]|uniref:DEAD/DEAH box helicase n=1 Tax=Gleimia sp. 6138-11-ORH1 TaxID=2973937 RepID=UPI0021687FB6|nr:DEAD/DEAH box helicase [Gleimia sp. 6138-11-ORH1]MCS4484723.1 DEAD/DEAH box helicase [Gleimia sp. 6138-11-ORH1]
MLAESDQGDSQKYLTTLVNLDGGSDRLRKRVHFPERPAELGTWPAWVLPEVVAAFNDTGVKQPWNHQIDAADAIWSGRHTVIATGTGSGKSLSAWLPVLNALQGRVAYAQRLTLQNWAKPPTAIYVAPTKALAADQAHQLSILEKQLTGVQVGVADGDAPKETKEWVRAEANLVLTNPDYLHHVMLPGNQRWVRLLSGLKYLVVDEMHYWRGMTGSHMALVLRRLLRVARRLGANPTVVFLSATVAEPRDTAGALIGVGSEEITAITADSSPAAARELLFWQPGFIFSEGDTEPKRVSATVEAAKLTAQLVAAGAKVLCFVRSRSAAESVAAQIKSALQVVNPVLQAAVAAYRGGYLPEERRELEAGLRGGDIRCLVTTNALELGIDISSLDVTVTVGWPGTRASFWQQVGRAGRAGNVGISVFVAADNPLDNYVISHPEMVFEPVEAATINPTNSYILMPHLCAAAAEQSLVSADALLFGLADDGYFKQLEQAGYLRKHPGGWFWNIELAVAPHSLTDLRGVAGEVQVIEAGTGRVVGTVSAGQADSQVHAGAVYVHQGDTYEIVEYLPVAGSDTGRAERGRGPSVSVALARKVTTEFRTISGARTSVYILGDAVKSWTSDLAEVTWRLGNTRVSEQVTDFDTFRLPKLEHVANTRLALPPRLLETQSVWFELSPAVHESLGIEAGELPGTLHACEHAMIAMLPLLATCDRWDLGGLSTVLHEQTLQPTVFIHDAFAGGAGFAAYGFNHAQKWVAATLDLVRACPCEYGCPSCIQSPKCGNKNNPLSKVGAISLLEFLLANAP